MRRLPALIAAVLGLACGYGYTRYLSPAATPPLDTGTTETAKAAPRAETPARVPRSSVRAPLSGKEHPLLARAASLGLPAMPPAHKGWSSELDELRRRAEQGDAAAANEWLERDSRCFAMMPLTPDAGATLPTAGFVRASMRGRSRLPSLDGDTLNASRIEDETQRTSALAAAQQRLLDECRGYVPEPPQVRYALGEIAARFGTDKDFWRFINEPPFAAGYSRDTEQAVDWARRAPAMVYERAVGGDAEAAFVLGVSYAIDRPRELDGDNDVRLLPATIPNDPLQAYRWLSVYLRGNPDGDHAMLARALMNRIAADLSAQQRAEAERWSP